MRKFWLERDVDESGISGTGQVAEGVIFSDGRVAMRWLTANMPSSTVLYDGITDVVTIHGHNGSTRVVVEDR